MCIYSRKIISLIVYIFNFAKATTSAGTGPIPEKIQVTSAPEVSMEKVTGQDLYEAIVMGDPAWRIVKRISVRNIIFWNPQSSFN